MDSVFLSPGKIEMSISRRIKRAKFFIRRKAEQYRKIHWLLKVPAIGVILLYIILMPTVILANKMKILINSALILGLVACVYVHGRSSGLQDGAVIGILQNPEIARLSDGDKEMLRSYLTVKETELAHHNPALKQQVFCTLQQRVEEWYEVEQKKGLER